MYIYIEREREREREREKDLSNLRISIHFYVSLYFWPLHLFQICFIIFLVEAVLDGSGSHFDMVLQKHNIFHDSLSAKNSVLKASTGEDPKVLAKKRKQAKAKRTKERATKRKAREEKKRMQAAKTIPASKLGGLLPAARKLPGIRTAANSVELKQQQKLKAAVGVLNDKVKKIILEKNRYG